MPAIVLVAIGITMLLAAALMGCTTELVSSEQAQTGNSVSASQAVSSESSSSAGKTSSASLPATSAGEALVPQDRMSSQAIGDQEQSSSSTAGNPQSTTAESSSKTEQTGARTRAEAPKLTDDIMGTTIISASSMVKLYSERGVPYPGHVYAQAGAPGIDEWCKLCVEESEIEGVRAEVLFAQAMHETAWLQFGNQVSVEQNNFGGLGAVNSGGPGASFATVREGLRAQVQHLKAYASEDELKQALVDPRFDLVTRGCAPKVPDLGGRWAWPGDGYGDAIMGIVEDLYEIEYPDAGKDAGAGAGQDVETESESGAGQVAETESEAVARQDAETESEAVAGQDAGMS